MHTPFDFFLKFPRVGVALIALVLVASDARLSGGHLVAQDPGRLTRYLGPSDTVSLEESEAVLNVLYNVNPDPSGGFLVADTREAQFRRYDEDGVLQWAFGSEGQGPNEFIGPVRALRLGMARVAFLDRRGKFAIYDEAGDSLILTSVTGLVRINDAAVTADGELWIATGIINPDQPSMFHRLDLTSGQVAERSFGPWPSEELSKERMYMNWSGIAVDGPDLLGVVATSDTIYRIDGETRSVDQKIPIRSELFRPLTVASAKEWAEVASRRRWAEGHSYITDVFPTQGDRFVVQFQTFRNGLPIWGLMLVGPDGDVLGEAMETNQLLTVLPDTDVLVFKDLGALDRAQWILTPLLQ